jgi:hypothetical protein
MTLLVRVLDREDREVVVTWMVTSMSVVEFETEAFSAFSS